MRMLPGAPALSDFRLSKLEARLRAAGVPECGLTAEFVHFVDLARPLDVDEEVVLTRLLRYGPSYGSTPEVSSRFAAEPSGPASPGVSIDGQPAAEAATAMRPGSAQEETTPAGILLLVVPRFGTISPWSSKATDIARHCGLDAVRRLERGIAYRLHPRSAGQARRGRARERHGAAARSHDRGGAA